MGEGKYVGSIRVGERDDDRMIFEDWNNCEGDPPRIRSRLYNEYLGGSGRDIRTSMQSYVDGLRRLATELEKYIPPPEHDTIDTRREKKLCMFDISVGGRAAGMWCNRLPIVAKVVTRSGDEGFACKDHLKEYRPRVAYPGNSYIETFEYLPGFDDEPTRVRRRR